MDKYTHKLELVRESPTVLSLRVFNDKAEEVAEGVVLSNTGTLFPWSTSYSIQGRSARTLKKYVTARRALKALYAEIRYTFHISEVQAPAQVFEDLL